MSLRLWLDKRTGPAELWRSALVLMLAGALCVLPISTNCTLRADTQKFLMDLAQVIDNATSNLIGDPVTAASLTAQVQALKPQLQALRLHTLLLHRGLFTGERSTFEKSLSLLMHCEHHTRTLVRAVNQMDSVNLNPAQVPIVLHLVEQLHGHIEALKTALADPYPARAARLEFWSESVAEIDVNSNEHSYWHLRQITHVLHQINSVIILRDEKYASGIKP